MPNTSGYHNNKTPSPPPSIPLTFPYLPLPSRHIHRASPTPSLTYSTSFASSSSATSSLGRKRGKPLPSHLWELRQAKQIRFGDGMVVEEVKEFETDEDESGARAAPKSLRTHIRFGDTFGSGTLSDAGFHNTVLDNDRSNDESAGLGNGVSPHHAEIANASTSGAEQFGSGMVFEAGVAVGSGYIASVAEGPGGEALSEEVAGDTSADEDGRGRKKRRVRKPRSRGMGCAGGNSGLGNLSSPAPLQPSGSGTSPTFSQSIDDTMMSAPADEPQASSAPYPFTFQAPSTGIDNLFTPPIITITAPTIEFGVDGGSSSSPSTTAQSTSVSMSRSQVPIHLATRADDDEESRQMEMAGGIRELDGEMADDGRVLSRLSTSPAGPRGMIGEGEGEAAAEAPDSRSTIPMAPKAESTGEQYFTPSPGSANLYGIDTRGILVEAEQAVNEHDGIEWRFPSVSRLEKGLFGLSGFTGHAAAPVSDSGTIIIPLDERPSPPGGEEFATHSNSHPAAVAAKLSRVRRNRSKQAIPPPSITQKQNSATTYNIASGGITLGSSSAPVRQDGFGSLPSAAAVVLPSIEMPHVPVISVSSLQDPALGLTAKIRAQHPLLPPKPGPALRTGGGAADRKRKWNQVAPPPTASAAREGIAVASPSSPTAEAGVVNIGRATPSSTSAGTPLVADPSRSSDATPPSKRPKRGRLVQAPPRTAVCLTPSALPIATNLPALPLPLARPNGGASVQHQIGGGKGKRKSRAVASALILGKRPAPTGLHGLEDNSKYGGDVSFHYPCCRCRSLSSAIPKSIGSRGLGVTQLFAYRLFCTTTGKQKDSRDPTQSLLWWDLLFASRVENATVNLDRSCSMEGWNRAEGSQAGDRVRWANQPHTRDTSGFDNTVTAINVDQTDLSSYTSATDTVLRRQPGLLPLLAHNGTDVSAHKTGLIICCGRTELGARWARGFGQGLPPSVDLDDPLLKVLLDLDRVCKSDELWSAKLGPIGVHRDFLRQILLGRSFWWETPGDRLITWLLAEVKFAAKLYGGPGLQNRNELEWGGHMWAAVHRSGIDQAFCKGHSGSKWEEESIWTGHEANSIVEYVAAAAFFDIYADDPCDWQDVGVDTIVRATNAVGMAFDGFPSIVAPIPVHLLAQHTPYTISDSFDWRSAVAQLFAQGYISGNVAGMVAVHHELLWRNLWGVVGESDYDVRTCIERSGQGLLRSYCRCHLAASATTDKLRANQGAITHNSDTLLGRAAMTGALKRSKIASTIAFQETSRRTGAVLDADLELIRFFNRLIGVSMFVADGKQRTLRPIEAPFIKVLGPDVAAMQQAKGGV